MVDMFRHKEDDYFPAQNKRVLERTKKYDTIGFEERKQLIRRVVEQNQKLSFVASKMSIKLSTAKFIVRSFKKHGKIFKKKSFEITQQSKSLQTLPQQNSLSQPIQFLYYPIYVYVPMQGSSPNINQIKPPLEGFKPVFSETSYQTWN